MKLSKLGEEVKLTLNLMQQDIDDGAHDELRMHLREVLLLKREVLQQDDEEYAEDVPMHSVVMTLSSLAPARESEQIEVGEEMFCPQRKCSEEVPLTSDELKAGGWWCGDVSEECRLDLAGAGVKSMADNWNDNAGARCAYKRYYGSYVDRSRMAVESDTLKQIHRVGNEFYWGEV